MTKLKGAAILGAMIFAGVTLLNSFPASSATSFLLVSAKRLQKACPDTGATESICKFVAAAADRLAGVDLSQPVPEDLVFKVLRKLRGPIKKELKDGCCDGPCEPADCPAVCEHPCGAGFDRCDNCVQVVTGIEAFLATNGTANSLSDTLSSACDGRFDDPAITAECIGQIEDLMPPLIDWMLANLPPVTACQNAALRACP